MSSAALTHTVQFRDAREHRVLVADGATISVLGDGLGTTIAVVMTRKDLSPVSETFEAVREGEGIRQIGPSDIQSDLSKSKEVTILLRPDHAREIAVHLLKLLTAMPEDQRKRYRIDDAGSSASPDFKR